MTYNFNQFGGIQMLLHALVSRATLVMAPSNQPHQAIEAIIEHGVTHVSATPTFWRLLVGAMRPGDQDRMRLEQITLGGEAVPDSLVAKLSEAFPGVRTSHIYGGTEFGPSISVRDGRTGLPASVLKRDSAVRMKVVDGELYVKSPGAMLGYHGEEDLEANWRPTGDLVELRGDRLHFVGRTSETINVGGAKVHPLPIEEVVSGIEGVALVRAYGRPNPITGSIVAIDVVAEHEVDEDRLAKEIRSACESLPRAARPRSVSFVPTLEMRGGKLRRPRAESQ